jgi:predicted metal-dependent HD superfamily phosphohydrolase
MNLQELLNKWNIKCDVNTLLAMWNESHRAYHTLNHLNDVIDQINENKSKFSGKEYEKLMLTALFHDCVYDPMKNDNEEKSADFFIECCQDKSNKDVLEVKQMILDTKTHEATTNLSESFNQYDMSIVERDFDQLLEWENGIREEYKAYGEQYKEGRLKFLESLLDKYPQNTENLLKLVDWVKENY